MLTSAVLIPGASKTPITCAAYHGLTNAIRELIEKTKPAQLLLLC
jgi:hypothetical protein